MSKSLQALALKNSATVQIAGSFYHGTTNPFRVFNPALCKSELGLWLTDNFDVANSYALDSFGVVLEFTVSLNRVAEYDICHHKPHLFEKLKWREFFIDNDYDGLKVINGSAFYVIAFHGNSAQWAKEIQPKK